MATPDKPSSISSPMDSPTDDELVIVLDPSGKDKLTVMNHDDYDATTISRATIKAATIKTDAHDEYSNATGQFIDSPVLGNTGKAKSIFINLSESDTDVGLGLKVIKGTQGALVREGHPATHDESIDGLKDYSVLLRDVNDKSGKQELSTRVGDLQRINNSTDSFNVFAPVNTTTNTTSPNSNIGLRILPTTLGQHQKIETFSSTKTQENRLIPDDLLNLGAQITLQSTNEIYIPKFGENQTSDSRAAQILLALASSTGPAKRTLGTKQPMSDLSPKSVLNSVRKDKLQINSSDSWPKLENGEETVMTYGSHNSWLVPFDGMTSANQVPATCILVGVAATAVVGMAETIAGLSAVENFIGINSYSDPGGTVSPVENIGNDDNNDIIKDEQYIANVRLGFLSLFGLNINYSGNVDDSLSFIASVASMAATKRVWKEHALMNIVARNVIRDITVGIQDEINGFGVQSPERIIKNMSSLHIVKFINTLASLGVIERKRINTGIRAEIDRASWTGDANANSTNAEINTKSPWPLDKLVSKNRVVNSFGKGGQRDLSVPNQNSSPLTWGTGTTPSMYLLPTTVKTAAGLADGTFEAGKLNSLDELGIKSDISGRIPKPEVDALERRLNASYMPFYLHDLRTNEIISFHAFIENMSDSFSANYDTQTAMGRVEPIYIYKNSSRDMSLSFRIVSTNEQDHSEMWWKINKLLTLVYPQFTSGRQLEIENDKFIQPYSQLVGASPMVRIRVGDVWKSNFSKFNVMRLFGLGDSSQFSLNDSQTIDSSLQRARNNDASAQRAELRGRKKEQLMKAMAPETIEETFGASDQVLLSFKPRPPSIHAMWADGGRQATKLKGVYKATGIFAESHTPIAIWYKMNLTAIEGNDNGREGNGLYTLIIPTSLAGAQFKRSLSNSPDIAIDENWLDTVWLPQQPTQNYMADTATQDTLMSGQNSIDAINKFFKGGSAADANPIMQAFESTSGQGIAGFISSIGIDWNDSRWSTEWNSETDSSRAPQMCKIDIKFLPIHDITPGMASNGFMTAPVYPVGKYANAFKKIIPPDSGENE